MAHFLKPSGALIVIDNMESPVPKEYHHLVPHRHGFDEGEIQKVFGDAGLTSISYRIMPAVDGDAELFIAKGVKLAV